MSVIIEELPNDPPEPAHPASSASRAQHPPEEQHEWHEASEHLHDPLDTDGDEAFADCEPEEPEEPSTHSAQARSDPAAQAEPPEAGGEAAADAEPQLSPEAFAAAVEHSERLKQEGNEAYSAGNLDTALGKYSEALETAPAGASQQRAMYAANKAAVQMKRENWKEAIRDCSEALSLDPAYVKALLRRAAGYEKIDDLEHSLQDYEKVVELQPSNQAAVANVRRLTPIVEKKREEMKEEMLGKLKDLGNTVLGKFGMSLDNFKAVKDPATGSYSINYQNS